MNGMELNVNYSILFLAYMWFGILFTKSSLSLSACQYKCGGDGKTERKRKIRGKGGGGKMQLEIWVFVPL